MSLSFARPRAMDVRVDPAGLPKALQSLGPVINAVPGWAPPQYRYREIPATKEALLALARWVGCQAELDGETVRITRGPAKPEFQGFIDFVLDGAAEGSWWAASTEGDRGVMDKDGLEYGYYNGDRNDESFHHRFEDREGKVFLGSGGLMNRTRQLLAADPALAPERVWDQIAGRVAGAYVSPGGRLVRPRPGAQLDAEIKALIPRILRERWMMDLLRNSVARGLSN